MLIDFYYTLQAFLDSGGPVLIAIALITFAMWSLVFERILYLALSYERYRQKTLRIWLKRTDRHSWNAQQVRDTMMARNNKKLHHNLPLINTLVAVCPLLGLLGTVTGMIEVFDVMAVTGSSNARSMASGVSRATIPTMAGMVGALSGVFAITWLQQKARNELKSLEQLLTLDK